MNTTIDMARFAAQVFGMEPTIQSSRDGLEQAKKQVKKAVINSNDTKGLYQYDYIGSEGLRLDCYLEYEAVYDGGTGPNSEESWPERITLFYALHKGEDIAEVLSEEVVSTIEKEALRQMEIDKSDDEFDRAADRWAE
jgi:hypothetical protein